MGKKGKYNKQPEQQQPKKKKMMITEEHLMDKTHMDQTEFIPFLPSESLYPPYTITNLQILRTIVRDLNYLLYADFKTFWASLLYNPSLKICLCSCLQHLHRPWLNEYKMKPEQQSVYQKIKYSEQLELTQALFKIILILYFRIVRVQEQNSELCNLYKLQEQITNKYILDIPRLLQLIEIYSSTNHEIVSSITKIFIKNYRASQNNKNQIVTSLSNFYEDFMEDIMEKIIDKTSRNINALKKITDREEFGIQFSYKRNVVGQLSPGEEQLRRKIMILMEIISFYQILNNIKTYFPENCADYVKCNGQIHTISENLFIQIEQAYKVWNNHNMGHNIYPLMNKIILDIRNYFIDFLKMCEGLLITQTIKSCTISSYIKCIDHMVQHYGRRSSLGKKASGTKRYMQLYAQILKQFDLNELLTTLYLDEVDNSTHGINIQYLIDFKLAIEELIIKIKGVQYRPEPQNNQYEVETQAGMEQNEEEIDNQIEEPVRKLSNISRGSRMGQFQEPEKMSNLEVMISKKDRQQNYYEKLHSQYRTKMTIEYEDEYDDLVDYQKRPMFEDDANRREGSSDGSSDQFDSQEEKLHLVKSVSNVSRNRSNIQPTNNTGGPKNGQGGQKGEYRSNNNNNNKGPKYERKQKVKYVAVRQKEAQKVIGKYSEKQMKAEPIKSRNYNKNKQYEDQQCFQDCKVRIKVEEKPNYNRYEDQQQQQDKKNNGEQNTYKKKNNHYNDGKNKGSNKQEQKKNKPKYIAKN